MPQDDLTRPMSLDYEKPSGSIVTVGPFALFAPRLVVPITTAFHMFTVFSLFSTVFSSDIDHPPRRSMTNTVLDALLLPLFAPLANVGAPGLLLVFVLVLNSFVWGFAVSGIWGYVCHR